MSQSREAQSEATSVDALTDKLRELLNKDNVWSHEYNGVLLEIEEAVAKINRLIEQAERLGRKKTLSEVTIWANNEMAKDHVALSNNLSKGDGE